MDLLDRIERHLAMAGITHHVHILEMNGDSFRLASSRKRKMDKEGSKMS